MLDIIIVNWNTCDQLFKCLNSIKRTSEFNIMVIDNASTDNSLKMLSRTFPYVQVINNSENVGYAKANNQGINVSNSKFICLLNSDTIVSPDCFNSMLSFMSNHPNAVACAPALRLPDGKLQTGAGGFEITLQSVFNYFLFLSSCFPGYFKGIFFHQVFFVKKGLPIKVDWLSGACLMVRNSVIERAGMLDESFFMYGEDVEWCRRLRKFGEICYLPNIEITHYHGASSKITDAISTKWLESLFTDLNNRYNKIQVIVLRLVISFGFLLRLIIYKVLSLNDFKYTTNVNAMMRYFIYSTFHK